MTDRPVLFSAPMVRALLDGSKTQTRRVAKVPADATDVRYWSPPSGRSQPGWADPGLNYWTPDASGRTLSNHLDRCPYGQPGDRLWVRETWAAPHSCDHLPPRHCDWPARFHYAASEERGGLRWRPSIHMPRWASRITLEVTGVRVERLQSISDDDLAAEGIQELIDAGVDHDGTPRDTYRVLWESLNGNDSWHANPWVWVVEFRRADCQSVASAASGSQTCARSDETGG